MTMTETEVVPQQEYDAALARIRDYRDQLQRADSQADQNSLDRAADLEILYRSMQWVDEVPAPKNKVWRGRPVDPKSRNRFAGWVLQQTGLSPSRVTQLHKANEVRGLISSALPINSARALQPFSRLRSAGYGDRIPDVYKRAVELAEGKSPTSKETTQAVRDYLAQFTTTQPPGAEIR